VLYPVQLLTSPHSRISDEAMAFQVTKDDSYANVYKRVPKNESKVYSTPNAQQEATLEGPQVIRMCTWKMMQWNLISHAGFATHIHKDSNGLCTWIYAHTGLKIWAVIRPKYKSRDNTRAKVQQLHKRLCYSPVNTLDEQAEIFTTFLSAGDVLQVFKTIHIHDAYH
jgi:hypothetical protein